MRHDSNTYTRQHPFSGPQRYAVHQCPTCQVHKVLPEGKTWLHDCSETTHQLLWTNAGTAKCTCTGCAWRGERSVRLKEGSMKIKQTFKAAHVGIA